MSESESDSSPPPDGNDGPIFPYEKTFYSAKDKEEIMAMPEIQREELLTERALQVDRHNQDMALRRLLASRERDASALEKKKRKAGDTDMEESQRKSSRQKTTLGGRKVGEASDAIEAYKRQREQKGKRDEVRRRDRDAAPKKRDRRSSSRDGHSEDEGSGVEWDDGKRHTSPMKPKDDPPAELRDIQRARIARSNFAQVCFYPNFDAAITNCYTRVNIGPNQETGENEYRLCLIKGRPLTFLRTFSYSNANI
jgi:RNA polymerase-associated protein RTF1